MCIPVQEVPSLSTLFSFLIGLISIALMVSVHELGHFIGARLSGITVETFAIGWGKAIRTWRRNGIEYRINFFPLGGYCKLKGAEDLIAAQTDADSELLASPGSLFSARPLMRIFTYLAGPLMNILFAVFLFIPFFLLPYSAYQDSAKVIVTSSYPELYGMETNAAEEGGMLSGDVILEINDTSVRSFQDISAFMSSYSGGEALKVEIARDCDILTLSVTPVESPSGRYLLGVAAALPPTIADIDEISPEAVAGLKAGDTIISLNGKETPFMADLLTGYLNEPGVLTVEVECEDGSRRILSYTPEVDGNGKALIRMSFLRNIVTREGQTLPEAFISSLEETAQMAGETVTLFGDLVTGEMKVSESLAGPLRISYVIGETLNSGMRSFFQLLAMVSISLGIANLLPLPALDGGAIMLSFIEWIRGKRLSARIYMKYQSVGLAILALLILFVLFSDALFFLS